MRPGRARTSPRRRVGHTQGGERWDRQPRDLPVPGGPEVHRRCGHNSGVARLQARLISREGSRRPRQGFGSGAGANGGVARDQPDGPERDRRQDGRAGQNAGGTAGHRSAAADPAGAGAATSVPDGRDSGDPESGLRAGQRLGPGDMPGKIRSRNRCHRGGPHVRRGTVASVMGVSLMGLDCRRHEGGENHEDHRRQQAHDRLIGDHEAGSHLLRSHNHARLPGVTVHREVWSWARSFKGR